MSQIPIDISTPNDGLGDPLRSAFESVNTMFTELYAKSVFKEAGDKRSQGNNNSRSQFICPLFRKGEFCGCNDFQKYCLYKGFFSLFAQRR